MNDVSYCKRKSEILTSENEDNNEENLKSTTAVLKTSQSGKTRLVTKVNQYDSIKIYLILPLFQGQIHN